MPPHRRPGQAQRSGAPIQDPLPQGAVGRRFVVSASRQTSPWGNGSWLSARTTAELEALARLHNGSSSSPYRSRFGVAMSPSSSSSSVSRGGVGFFALSSAVFVLGGALGLAVLAMAAPGW